MSSEDEKKQTLKRILILCLLVLLSIFAWPIGIPIILLYIYSWRERRTVSEYENDGVRLGKRLEPGMQEENFVSRNLDGLNPYYYRVINNIHLPSSGNTSITQIDHIVVSVYGIFCIETKSHQGWIFGSANRKYWTETFYKKKFKIYNPLWQNYAHKKAIEYLLADKLKSPVRSFVAFPSAGRIAVNGTDAVGHMGEIIDKIKKFDKPIYSGEECSDIIHLVYMSNITSRELHEIHKSEVRNLVNIGC